MKSHMKFPELSLPESEECNFLEVTYMCRWPCGNTPRHHVINDDIRDRLEVENITIKWQRLDEEEEDAVGPIYLFHVGLQRKLIGMYISDRLITTYDAHFYYIL